MSKADPHTTAEAAMRAGMARAIRGLIAELERKGRAASHIKATALEGREQLAIAAKLRAEAKRTGWA